MSCRSGPYLYWPLDDGSGPALDRSENARNGTYIGPERGVDAPVPIGDSGRVSGFDPGDYVAASSATVAQFDRAAAFSGSCLVRFTGRNPVSSGGRVRLFGNGLNTSTLRGWTIFVTGRGIDLILANDHGGTNALRVVGHLSVLDGGWHHVAFTYDGTSTVAGVALYVDGEAIVVSDGGGTLSSTIVDASQSFRVGPWTSKPGLSYEVGHVAVFSRELTATEVKSQYEAAFRPLALHRSDARVASLLDALCVDDAERDLRYGLATLDVARDLSGSELDHGQEVARAELGALYVRHDGLITFDDRYANSYDTGLNLTIGDSGTEIRYTDIQLNTEDFDLTTEVHTRRTPDGVEITQTDTGAEDDFSPRASSIEAPWSDDHQPREVGAIVLERQSTEATRFESLRFKSAPSSWKDVIDIVTHGLHRARVTIKRRPPGGGSAISEDSVCERMSWSADRGDESTVSVTAGFVPDDGSRSDLFLLGRSALDATGKLA